jgi:hypothetical protein
MQTYRTVLVLLIVAICSVAGIAVDDQQAPRRDARPAPIRDPAPRGKAPQTPTGSASISGTVVAVSSDEPLADVTVGLAAPAIAGSRISTTTDSQGRFEFTKLAAGRYWVGASKAGFVNVTHGQRHYGRGGRAIPVRDGEHRDIRLPLPRVSAISGVVVGARGSPVGNASVRAFRSSMANGYRRWTSVGSARTDDGGVYRIISVQPGDYAVCASTRETEPLNDAQRLRAQIDLERRTVEYVLGPEGVAAQLRAAPRLAALEGRLPSRVDPVFGYADICHPGTPELPSMVRVAPNEERIGVNFQLALARLARIEGVALGMPRLNTSMDPIVLVNANEMEAGALEGARPNLEGRFRFTNVPPGRYRLVLRGTAGELLPNLRVGADADVVVADEDISNIVLDLQPAATVEGKVVFSGTSRPPSAIVARVQVRLDPAVPGPLSMYQGPVIATPDPTGRFVLADVFPGDYRVSAIFREDTGWFVDSSTLAGRDVLDQSLEVKANQSVTGVVVTLTDQRAELSGTIVTEKGEPAPEYLILVYPADQRYWGALSRRMLGTRSGYDGRFVIRGLRAGDYRVATLLDPEIGAWFDPEFLRQLESSSNPLSIAHGERKRLNLRVPDGR